MLWDHVSPVHQLDKLAYLKYAVDLFDAWLQLGCSSAAAADQVSTAVFEQQQPPEGYQRKTCQDVAHVARHVPCRHPAVQLFHTFVWQLHALIHALCALGNVAAVMMLALVTNPSWMTSHRERSTAVIIILMRPG
jgi:hypothetical protein